MTIDNQTVMNWVKLILDYATWPITLIIVSFIFRTPLKELTNKIKTFKFNNGKSSVEATMGEHTNATALPAPLTTDTISLPSTPSSENDDTKEENSHWISKVQNEIKNGNIIGARKVFSQHAESLSDDQQAHIDKAFLLYLIYDKTNDSEILLELERHTKNPPTEEAMVTSSTWYAMCLEKTKNFRAALSHLNTILEKVENPVNKTEILIQIAESHLLNADTITAKEIVVQRLQENLSDIENYKLYKRLSEIELKLGNKKTSTLCLDKALEYQPNDKDVMFKSAYEASTINLKAIELSNYDTLVSVDKEYSMAMNNFGASAHDVGLITIAVDYYIKSGELGNTLSMANLGNKLLNEGFINKADELAQKAIAIGNPHKNIYNLLKNIKEKREEDMKKWKEIKSKSFEKQKKIRNYTAAIYKEDEKKDIEVEWVTNNGLSAKLELLDHSIFKLDISYPQDEDTSANIFGSIINNGFTGVYTKTKGKNSSTLLSGGKESTVVCVGYLHNNASEIVFFSEDIDQEFEITLTRKQASKELCM
ncbi:tetratricopeptide repeat protein [Serratia ureilytica]|uniref:tetratricopeptide repeat protein n=1 Tax=Serratia ureilytica TaxID=300181 RepID=UPI00235FEC1F|nr:hypothetical protein [Serratia ureilytica]